MIYISCGFVEDSEILRLYICVKLHYKSSALCRLKLGYVIGYVKSFTFLRIRNFEWFRLFFLRFCFGCLLLVYDDVIYSRFQGQSL